MPQSAQEITSPPTPLVSVVLPCLNEADSVGLCVKEALDTMAGAGIVGEVIVVDNGSTDGSADVARAAGARVLDQRRWRGYGAAIRTGFLGARGSILVMADADWTYDFRRIPDLIAPVVAGEADLVLGSRLSEATSQNMPFLHRWLGTPTLTLLQRISGGPREVTDSQSGYRALRRDDYLRMGLATTGMDFASEMLIAAGRLGLRVKDIPCGYRERIGESKLSTLRDGWRHLRLILSMTPHLLLGAIGALTLLVGFGLTAVSFVSSTGLHLGFGHSGTVFLSNIALALGTNGVLISLVQARRAALAHRGAPHLFSFTARDDFPRILILLGLIHLAIGGGIEATLMARSLADGGAPAWASLAESFMIAGATFATFGVLSFFTHERLVDEELASGAEAEHHAQHRAAPQRAAYARSLSGREDPEPAAA